MKETIEDTKEYYLLSKDDEARLGHKSVDSSFFGYKTHRAMTALLQAKKVMALNYPDYWRSANRMECKWIR